MRILKREGKRFTVLTSSGVELVCKPVRQLPVQDLLFRIGLNQATVQESSPEKMQAALQEGSTSEKVESAEAALALFNYCMAYGVVTDPPQEAVDELKALHLAPSNLNALRATWLNYLVLEDAQEAGLLAGVIMALTFRGDDLPDMDIPESE